MIRGLYHGLLWLHPPSFRERFEEEFLWIFDLERSSQTGMSLLFECFVSLCRQWFLRSSLWKFGIGVLVNLILGHRILFGIIL